MYVILNILVFILLTSYALVLMMSKPSYVSLSKTEKVLLTGREKFLLLTLVTGMVSVSGASLGVQLSALRLMVWILMIIMAFVLYEDSLQLSIIVMIYALFLGWASMSLIWAEDSNYGIRVLLKYLYPFLIMLFASTFVKAEEFIFITMRWLILASLFYSLILGGVMTHVLDSCFFHRTGIFWPMSTLNDFQAIISAISLVMFWRTKEKRYLLLILWFSLSALLQSVRTGMLSIGLVLMVASFLRYKILALPFIAGLFSIGVFSILNVPTLKKKMFYEPDSVKTVSDILGASEANNLNTSAREAMWEHLLEKIYNGHEWIGSGLGSVQKYMYENFIFGGLTVPHSDYVQMLCDLGNVGLLLYLLFPLSLFLFLFKKASNKTSNALNISAALAILSYAATLPAMAFDNVVNYSFAAHSYPFIFAGIFFAYNRQQTFRDTL